MAVSGAGGRAGAGVAITALAAVAISLSLVLSPLVYQAGGTPLTLMAVRPLVFAAIVWLVFRLGRRQMDLPPAKRRTAFAVGLVYLVGAGGYVSSVLYLPVSLAVLIFYTFPILTLIMTSLLDRRAPRLIDLGALLTAFLGLALALGVSFETLDPRGIALVSVGALGAAGSFVWMGRALGDRDTAAVTYHMSLSGGLVALGVAAATGSLSFPAGAAEGWVLLAAVVASFVVGFFAMFRGVALIGAVRAATIMNLEPVATIALAVLLLSERLDAWQVLGAALVILAVDAEEWG